MENFFWSAVNPKTMAGLAVASIAVMLFIGLIPYKGKKVNTTKFWKDWGFTILIIVCVAGSFAPGIHDIPLSDWGGVLVHGMVTAIAAYLGRKALKPMFLSRLEGKK